MSAREHHKHSRTDLKVAVITASDSRTPETDESGMLIRRLFVAAGHRVVSHEIVPDHPERIRQAIVGCMPSADAIVITGGTGIARRDSTVEVVRPMLDKEIEGFGELFRMLSFQEIGPAAMLSRAVAGVSRGKILVALPGSTAACQLAIEKLLLPEIGHMADLLSQ
ncbi:MAG: MogA/MoaB family molybdenum cofactor biosynthesis protein [Candidatus Binataceae bacterium]